MHRARYVLLLAGLVLVGAATAQCPRGPTTSELSIRGFGAAYFEQVKTDSAHDRVEFYGGVCLTGEGVAWTLLADRVTITGLSGQLAVSAAAPTLRVVGWTLKAESLEATRQRITLSAVELAGRDMSGTASAAALDLEAGTMALSRVDLRGSTFEVSGTSAVLDAHTATVVAPVITTCTCVGPPLYDVAGSSARIDLEGSSVVLRDGRLKVGAVTIPLSDTVTLSEKALKALTLPLNVAYVPTDTAAGVTGTGLGVTVGPLRLGPGVHAEVGAVGLDPTYPFSAVALLSGAASGSTFTFGKAPEGLRMAMTSDHAVLPWLDAGFDVRVLEPGNRDTLREGVLHARAHAPVPALGGGVALSVLAAGSSQLPASGEVAGARLGAAVSGTAATVAAPWGRATLHWSAGVTTYPNQHASQWGIDLQPGYSVALGPVSLQAGYLAQFTNGGSPFTINLDRLEPTQRPSLQASVRGPLAPGWTASAKLQVSYDLVGSSSVDAGLNQLDVSGTLTHQLGVWRLQLGTDAVLAGVIAPNGVRDGYLQASLDARNAALEFGARARYRYAPDPTGLELLQLSAAVPISLPGVEVRPYLALDFAPTVTAGSLPAISGHGLDLTFVTCCGALQLGYRDDDGTWTVSASVDMQRRATEQASTSGCGPVVAAAPAIAPSSGAMSTCTGAPGGAGIMTGAASGVPPP